MPHSYTKKVSILWFSNLRDLRWLWNNFKSRKGAAHYNDVQYKYGELKCKVDCV